ncbi:MAG: hypothetical protein KW788_05130 [Candidatus Doudnabacteria bacterium]|nr:hypothetical protein [Candidatus Doudnabacteria bacterium]
MRIANDVYQDGSKDLSLKTEDGVRLMSVGVLFPGTHDLGVAEDLMVVRVTSGEIEINGEHYERGDHRIATIKKGEKIEFRNTNYATYHAKIGYTGGL